MAFSLEAAAFTWDAAYGGALIALARMTDVALGVLRVANVAAGRRASAWGIAFIEAMIWVFAVSGVVKNLDNPVYAVFYALGFATGTFVGMTFERLLARGERVVRVFTHMGEVMATALRDKGYRVTQFEGKGLQGPIQLLFIQVPRRAARELPLQARALDPDCFMVIDDIRTSLTSREPLSSDELAK